MVAAVLPPGSIRYKLFDPLPTYKYMYPPSGIVVVGVNVTVSLASALFSRRSRGSIAILGFVTDVCAATGGRSTSTDAAKIKKASRSITNDVLIAASTFWHFLAISSR